MIVNRHVYQAKSMKVTQMVQECKRVLEETPWPGGTTRIYQIHTGPFNQVAVEFEAESLADFEAAWTDWTSKAWTDASAAAWNEVDSGEGYTEFWTLE